MVWKPMPGPEDGEPRKVGDSLPTVTKRFGLPRPQTLSVVFARWAEVVGSPLCLHATPTGLRDHVLSIEVDEPAWATQLRFLRNDLLLRLNDAAGEGTILDINVRVAGPRQGRVRANRDDAQHSETRDRQGRTHVARGGTDDGGRNDQNDQQENQPSEHKNDHQNDQQIERKNRSKSARLTAVETAVSPSGRKAPEPRKKKGKTTR